MQTFVRTRTRTRTLKLSRILELGIKTNADTPPEPPTADANSSVGEDEREMMLAVQEAEEVSRITSCV